MVPFVAACAFVAFAAQLVMGDHDTAGSIGARPFVLSVVALLVSGFAFARSRFAPPERPRSTCGISGALGFVFASGALTLAFGIAAQYLGEGTTPDASDAAGWLVSALFASMLAAIVAMLVAAVPAIVATLSTFVERRERVHLLTRELRTRRRLRSALLRWSPSVGNRPPPQILRASI